MLLTDHSADEMAKNGESIQYSDGVDSENYPTATVCVDVRLRCKLPVCCDRSDLLKEVKNGVDVQQWRLEQVYL